MFSKSIFSRPSVPNQKINYPIVGLLTATLVLLLVVGFLTYLNYDREKELLKDHLKRQGVTIIRALEAGARSRMMEMMWRENQIQSLLRETAKGPNIARILLVGEENKIIADSAPDSAAWYAKKFLAPQNKDDTIALVYRSKSDQNIFRVIRNFIPLNENLKSDGRWSGSCCPAELSNGGYFIVLDLKMQEYQAAQAEDIRLAALYGLILFIIGSASLYFLQLAQNYYVANRTIKTMESYTRNVVESMPNGLISLDRKQHIETINRNALRLLKLDPETVKSKPLSDILHNCKLPDALLPGEDIFQKQVECHLNDGTNVPLSITSSRLKDDNDQIIGSVLILRDMRDIRTLEKQVQRSERLASLGRMAAGIAHEIRNPLSSIKGFAQYFRNKFREDSEDYNYARVMINEVDRLNRVIQDLLNFAKPQEPKFSEVEVQELIRHSLQLVQPDIQSKNIQVVENYAKKPPTIIVADSDMITQVFLNIFLNAVEAMSSDGLLKIDITDKNKHTEITISDDGCGISPEKISHIFDPFYTSKRDGTGLGLAIVYRIMENHNGVVEVDSSIGNGTIFRLIFFRKG